MTNISRLKLFSWFCALPQRRLRHTSLTLLILITGSCGGGLLPPGFVSGRHFFWCMNGSTAAPDPSTDYAMMVTVWPPQSMWKMLKHTISQCCTDKEHLFVVFMILGGCFGIYFFIFIGADLRADQAVFNSLPPNRRG